jgi:hypothetical protein
VLFAESQESITRSFATFTLMQTENASGKRLGARHGLPGRVGVRQNVRNTNMATIRTKHPVLQLIIKAEVEPGQSPDMSKITFGLPTKASKLEKFLLKLVEIYSYDVLRNNMYDTLINSPEYKKHLMKRVR